MITFFVIKPIHVIVAGLKQRAKNALERALKLEPISLTVLGVLLSFVECQMSVP